MNLVRAFGAVCIHAALVCFLFYFVQRNEFPKATIRCHIFSKPRTIVNMIG